MPPTQQPNQFYLYTEIESCSIPNIETKSISTITKTKSISMLTLKTSNFRPTHQNKIKFDPRTKNMLISAITLKTSYFLFPKQKQSYFRPQRSSQANFDTHSKKSQFCMPPHPKTKLISIQTLTEVIFDPHTKPSQFWSIHWDHVNSDPPHWNHVYFDHRHNKQVTFDANTWTSHFQGVLLCVLYVPSHVLVIQQQHL